MSNCFLTKKEKEILEQKTLEKKILEKIKVPISKFIEEASILRRVLKKVEYHNDDIFYGKTIKVDSLTDIEKFYSKKFIIIDKIQKEISQELLKFEIEFLNECMDKYDNIVVKSSNNSENIYIKIKENMNSDTKYILMHPKRYKEIKTLLDKDDEYKESSGRNFLMFSIFGYIKNAEIFLSNYLKKDNIYLFPSSELSGEYSIIKDINIVKKDFLETNKIKLVAHNTLGVKLNQNVVTLINIEKETRI